MLQPPKKKTAWVGAGALVLVLAAGAKSVGVLKGVGAAFLGLFAHGAGTEALVVTQAAAHAGQTAALLPAAREVPALSSSVSRVAVQVLVRMPGEEREQLASLAGEPRDAFLILIAEQDIKAAGLKGYVSGPFRDWVPETILALERHGRNAEADAIRRAAGSATD